MKKRLTAILIIMIFCFTGCVQKNNIDENSNSKAKSNVSVTTVKKEEKNQVTFDYESINKDKKDKEGKVLLKWNCSYPVFKFSNDSDMAEKINSLIKGKVDEFEKNIVESNSTLFDDSGDQSTLMGIPYSGFYEATVKRCDDTVISLKITDSRFTGGAHSNQSYTGITIDAKTGKEIPFESLSDSGAKLYDDVSNYVTELSSQQSYKNKLTMNSNVDVHEFVNDNKWYLSEGGIVLMSEPYELACYAEGSVEFAMPYENISDFKKSYAYDGNYKLHSRTDYELNKDLNGDGKEENILVSGRNSDMVDLNIDGMDYEDQLNDIDLSNVHSFDYYIVDLDKSDKYKEVAIEVRKTEAIYQETESGVKLNDFTGSTYFYRYKGDSKIEYCGCIDKLISNCSIDYSKEKLNSAKTEQKEKTTDTAKISVDQGEKLIREQEKVPADVTVQYTKDFTAKQFGIPEETYMYYSYKEAEGPTYMVGVKSKNLYIGPSNGDLYFDLMKDGKAVKKYNLIQK